MPNEDKRLLPSLLSTSPRSCGFYTSQSAISSKSSFLHSDSAAEGNDVNRFQPSCMYITYLQTVIMLLLNCSLSFFFLHFPSPLDHIDIISSILNVSFIPCLAFLFRRASASSGCKHSSRTWQALIASRAGYGDCDRYSLLQSIL